MRKSVSAKTRMPAPDKRHLIVYVLGAYAFTWALWIPPLLYSARTGWPIPSIAQGFGSWAELTTLQTAMALSFQLAVYGPAAAALVSLLSVRNRNGLQPWVASIVRFRVPPRWYLFVILAPLALAAIVVAAGLVLGGYLTPAGIPALGALGLMVIAQTVTSGMEEPGWRGYALPLLQRTHTAENASWHLGLIWAGWHLPYMLYLYRGLPSWQLPLTVAGFTMSIVGMGYVHAWVYNSTGSVAMNVILHGWANATNAVVAAVILSPITPLATAGVTWLFVAWLFRRYGKQTLSAGGHAQQAHP